MMTNFIIILKNKLYLYSIILFFINETNRRNNFISRKSKFMKHLIIQSLEELRKKRKAIRNVNIEHKKKITGLARIALWITEYVGSMGFLILVLSWTGLWLAWNTLAPQTYRFDPYPAFVLWLFISNMLQIFLMPLIMIGQNLQAEHSELRAEADFEINTKAESEIETILMHLENQNEMILKILDRLEKKES